MWKEEVFSRSLEHLYATSWRFSTRWNTFGLPVLSISSFIWKCKTLKHSPGTSRFNVRFSNCCVAAGSTKPPVLVSTVVFKVSHVFPANCRTLSTSRSLCTDRKRSLILKQRDSGDPEYHSSTLHWFQCILIHSCRGNLVRKNGQRTGSKQVNFKLKDSSDSDKIIC